MTESLVGLDHTLHSLATREGTICALALDHRDAMRNAFRRVGISDVSESVVLELKARILDALVEAASALLIDPRALVHCGPVSVGVLMPLEAQGYAASGGGRLTRLLPDFLPADAAELGVQGCKLLLYYRADHSETAIRQRELATRVAAECHGYGLPLVVEPLIYRLAGEDAETYRRRFAALVVEAARDLADAGADLLKLQFPGDPRSCERVTDAAAPLHWTLLGGSDVDPATFAAQLRVACSAGACGFIAGRAIWGGALALRAGDQSAWLRGHARALFDQLVDIADTYARRVR